MATPEDQIRACIWMQRHYRQRALECRDTYNDLADFYLVYDHYMTAVQMWGDKLDALFNDHFE